MKAFGSQILAEFIGCKAPVLDRADTLEALLKEGILKFDLQLKTINSYQFEPVGVTAIAIIGESHVALHTYPEEKHLSLDIFTCSPGSRGPAKLMAFLKERLQPELVRFKDFYRGKKIELQETDYINEFSSGHFDIRYHIEQELLEQRTQYQHLRIIENQQFGRMLFLDNQLQIAENDAYLYNQAMVNPLRAARIQPKHVAILGGGDGGVLSEVLSLNPQKAYLVDIDGEVIAAAQAYLPAICRGAFEDPRAEVVVSDAGSFIGHQQNLDAVIYDLTMSPEVAAQLERERYFEDLFASIAQSLKPGGLITMQCASVFDQETQDFTRQLLERHFHQVHFQEVMIPSFCEGWVFASAVKQ